VDARFRKLKVAGASPKEVFIEAWIKHNSDTARGVVKILFKLQNEELANTVLEAKSDIYSKFQFLVTEGYLPVDIFRIGLASGFDRFDSQQLITYLFDLHFEEAVEHSHEQSSLSNKEIEELAHKAGWQETS